MINVNYNEFQRLFLLASLIELFPIPTVIDWISF